MSEGIIAVNNLNFYYEDSVQILNQISVSFQKNRITGIYGPNGCGKTTMLKCLSNIYRNYDGMISFNGSPLKKLNPLETSKILSYVPQEHDLAFPYKVYEIILMGRNPKINIFSKPSKKDIEICKEAMCLTNIIDLAFKPYLSLSGGQRQLVLITRAIVQETPIIILDEPTSALDFKNQINIWNILNKLKENKTIIICTHDPNHIVWFCDHTLVMNQGKLIKFGDVEHVINKETLNMLYGDICSVNQLEKSVCITPSYIY